MELESSGGLPIQDEEKTRDIELREYEKHFSSMLSNVALACVILNSEFKIFYINNYLLDTTGRKREEVIGKRWGDLFVPESERNSLESLYSRIKTEGEDPPSHENKMLATREGQTVLFEWNNSVIRSKFGTFLGLSSIGKIKTANSEDIKGATNPQISISKGSPEKNVGNYTLVKALGGANGHVQLGVHRRSNQRVAIKGLVKQQMNSDELDRARREIKIMERLNEFNNRYIVKMIEWHETQTHFYIISEYVSGGELMDFIDEKGGLSEPQARKLFKQLLNAIECCHQHQIIHRDLKLQNILLDSHGDIKLIDFGLSNFVSPGFFRNTFCGTPAFAPPEILLGAEYQGPEVDVWSLGVVLFTMLTNEFPFQTVGEILQGKYKMPDKISSECKDLILRLFVRKEERLNLSQVIAHPWVMNTGADDSNAILGIGSASNILEPDVKRRKSC